MILTTEFTSGPLSWGWDSRWKMEVASSERRWRSQLVICAIWLWQSRRRFCSPWMPGRCRWSSYRIQKLTPRTTKRWPRSGDMSGCSRPSLSGTTENCPITRTRISLHSSSSCRSLRTTARGASSCVLSMFTSWSSCRRSNTIGSYWMLASTSVAIATSWWCMCSRTDVYYFTHNFDTILVQVIVGEFR